MPLKILKICLGAFFILGPIGYIFSQNVFGVIAFLLLIAIIISFITYEIDKILHPKKYIGYSEADKEQIINNAVEKYKNLSSEGILPSVHDVLRDEKALISKPFSENFNKDIKVETKKRLEKSGHYTFSPRAIKAIILSFIPIIAFLIYKFIIELIKIIKYYF